MTTVVHILSGSTVYGSINKKTMTSKMKIALLLASLGAGIAPDIDTISKYWDSGIMYRMWHRGITHSIFFIPVWIFIITLLVRLVFKFWNRTVFLTIFLSVSSHIFLDLLNQWGTGIFEPFSQGRFSIGVVSFRDTILPGTMFFGVIIGVLFRKYSHGIFRVTAALIVFYIIAQSIMGYMVLKPFEKSYQEKILSAGQIPGTYRIIGKNGSVVDIIDASISKGAKITYSFVSSDKTDLSPLFNERPQAKILYQWAPMVVVIEDENQLGIFDPRFYFNGHSFLYEYIKQR